MTNDERMYWSAIAVSMAVVAYSFWVFSMETVASRSFYVWSMKGNK